VRSWKFQIERNYELLADPDVPIEILDDVPFLLRVARANVKSFAFMPERIRHDRRLVREIIKDNPDGWRLFPICPEHGLLRRDRELFLAVVQGPGQGWRALRYIDDMLRNDEDFMLQVTNACGLAVEYASPNVRAKDEIVIAAITQQASQVKGLTDSTSRGTDDRGETTKLVQIVALKIKRSNGTLLVWMGHREHDGKVIAKCVLPRGKFAEGESPKDAVDNLLNNELRPLAKGIQLKTGYKVNSRMTFSEKYQCLIQYSTTIFEANFDPSFDLLSVTTPLQVDAIDLRPRSAFRSHESFCRRFCVEGTHARPDMFVLKYGDREKQWPPITCDWPPRKTEIFAWVPSWELSWLTTSNVGASALQNWISQLNFRHHSTCSAAQDAEVEVEKHRHKQVHFRRASSKSSPCL
jgi:hypothetical protein